VVVPGLTPSIEFALLADAVQAMNGKLFVLGGGWDTIWVRSFPARHHTMAIGTRLRIPWSSEPQTFELTVQLVDEDGKPIFDTIRHSLTVAPPKGVPDGFEHGVVRAFTFNNVPFHQPGEYSFVMAIDGAETGRLRFSVRERRAELA